ncbi:hypothetical protein Sango_2796100 [Sesamum angolense]|uniref:Reverse transcriptase n=1 Tax=Sesamum angolense TaxID=2727404 RepID=A0AAE1T773_9LAMI|nr:hypothetical protein Sango_2796100 [Sesamum angolense]
MELKDHGLRSCPVCCGLTGETPFCLVYESEALIPTEIGEETARVAQYNLEECEQAYNSRVKSRNFQVGDMVLKKVEVSRHVGKLDPSWEGPYQVIEVKRKGTCRLQNLEGNELPRPWNVQNLREFYA